MRRLWVWGSVLVPLLAGLLAAAWLWFNPGSNPRVYVSAPLSTWLVILSAALGSLSLASAGAWELAGRRSRRSLAAAQLQSAAERRQFLRRLDHELKNPLTAIQAGLALLSSEPAQAESTQSTLHSVDAQVRRIGRLTADLRKLAELESRPIERRAVNLAELLTQAFELTRDRPETVERRLSLALPKAPWPLATISGDYDLLLLAVHNLFDNAIKYTRPGDTLEVRAFEDGASVVVEVADTGPGIPADELPHIWDELYRGAGARGVPGSGLGLALSRAIILRHGGQLAARSRAGQGTVFTMRLPLRSV